MGSQLPLEPICQNFNSIQSTTSDRLEIKIPPKDPIAIVIVVFISFFPYRLNSKTIYLGIKQAKLFT